MSGADQIVAHIVADPGFAPTPRDLRVALAAVIRADAGAVLTHLAGINGIDINGRFPFGVNGHRARLLESDNDIHRHRGGKMVLPDVPEGLPPLLAAARLARRDAFEGLIRIPGIDLNVRGDHGQTVLFEMLGHLMNMAETVVRAGLDVNAQDHIGNTALMHAILKRDVVLVQSLTHMGIDLNLKNVYGVLFFLIRPLGRWHMGWLEYP
jgi:hypothetical protein